MSPSYWLVLIIGHIAIPSAICFVVIFYTWRFFTFVKRKFTEFRQQIDGYK